MPCANCLTASTRPNWGGYDFACVGCCARLVASARPDKSLQRAHLAAIDIFRAKGMAAPSEAEILDGLKRSTSCSPSPK